MVKTKITQLVPEKVWKLVYDQFLCEHPDSKFAEETLKERLWKTLKELKIGISNDKDPIGLFCKPMIFLPA